MHGLKSCIQDILLYDGLNEIKSYEEYYHNVVFKKYAPTTLNCKKHYLGILWDFDLHGIYPSPDVHTRFLREDKYEVLNQEYKKIVDNYTISMRLEGLRTSTVLSRVYSINSFLEYLQVIGFESLTDVADSAVRSYFINGGKIIRGRDVVDKLRSVLQASASLIDGCEMVISFLPRVRKVKKEYDALSADEVSRLKKVIDHMEEEGFSLRDTAIIKTILHLGIRRGDVAVLRLENIDFNSHRICFTQSKTGIYVEVPLRPVVGNTIFNYITEERPVSPLPQVFLSSRNGRIWPISSCAVYNIAESIYDKANVRTNGGRRGLHILRHLLASSLINNGCNVLEVSSILGQTSPSSLSTYLSTDYNRLKECALSIDKYPVNDRVFKL